MRIGIDARELCGRSTGVGRYLAGLLDHWRRDEHARSHEFVLYVSDGTAGRPLFDEHRFRTRLVGGSPGAWWEQVRLPRVASDDHLDVFFAPAYSAPLRIGCPTVVAIHDLSFVAHPEWFTFREGVRLRWLVRQAANRARRVITISEFSKRELIDRLGISESRIHVIPPGIGLPVASDPWLGPQRTRRSASPNDLAARPSVLYVGSIFNRRHVPDLLKAFAGLVCRHPEVSLEIVGDNRSYPKQDIRETIALEGLDGQVRWHEYASDEILGDLYADATAFAFLSEYEGLGLTPLEALANGVTPVLLDTPVARESCGDAALYVPMNDLPATTTALERALFDAETRRRLLAAAPAVLAKYSWPRAGRATLGVLEGAATSG